MSKHRIQLGNIPVTSGVESIKRMAILLWGEAGCGKTTFAATAPGTKLWISLGDNEHYPVSHRKDVMVANVSGMKSEELFKHAQGDDPFGLDKALADNLEIETVVLDNLTGLAHKALQQAVKLGVGGGKDFRPSITSPGLSAYGGRNGLVLDVVEGLLRVTNKHGVHIIITAHEGDPSTAQVDGKEIIEKIAIMLGGQLVNNMTYRFSEIWYMSFDQTAERNRRLMVRPTRKRRPVKTRMFDGRDEPEFKLTYDADRPDKGQMTITSWYEKYKAGAGAKLPIPGSRKVLKR